MRTVLCYTSGKKLKSPELAVGIAGPVEVHGQQICALDQDHVDDGVPGRVGLVPPARVRRPRPVVPRRRRGRGHVRHDGARSVRAALRLQLQGQTQLAQVLVVAPLLEGDGQLLLLVQLELGQGDGGLAHEVVPEGPVVVVDLAKKTQFLLFATNNEELK